MGRSYDNWERLVTATLRREDDRIIAQRTPTPSELSLASLSSFSSFNLASSSCRVSSFSFSSLLAGELFSYKQILQATDWFSESNLIKHGSSGDLFYGVLEGRTQVVVKKIDLSSVNKESLFVSELEVLGKVSHHHRFVPLVGQCLENANEKCLVYELMANKDLSTSLSRKIESGNRRKLPFLDWITRLKIATEVAEGLSYLHECVPPLVHSDIQASSILLDDKFDVKLGSLYEVCAEEKDMRQTATFRAFGEGTFAAAPTTSLRQDIKRASVIWDQEAGRYVSVPVPASDTRGRSLLPEGSKTRTGLKMDDKRPVTFLSPGTSNDSYASCTYDVYSFGKVLLELVTGKLGLSATDDSALNGWMENVLSYILPHDVEVVVNIIDSSLLRAKHLLAQAWAVSFIAKACLSPESSERPRMAQIHLALEHIESASFTNKNLNFTGNHDSVRSAAMEIAKILWGCKIVGRTAQATASGTTLGGGTASRNHRISEAGDFEETYPNGGIFSQPNLTIFYYAELKAAIRHFGSDIGMRELEFGRVYQAWLQDKSTLMHGKGSIVAVRNLSSETKQLLKSRISSLGRLSHPNLVKFLGYCEDKELCVVHEFMQSGSLDNQLFGAGSEVQPLSWDTRLNILIGAARGLAFLHATQEQGFYEYFGTSDILLDGAYNTKISGFGTAKITPLSYLYDVHPNFFRNGRYVDAPPENVFPGANAGLSTKGRQRLSWGEINPVLCFMDLKRDRLEKIMDPKLKGQYSFKVAQKLGSLASICLQHDPEFRPSMKVVVEVLEHVAAAKVETQKPWINQKAYQQVQQL
ncbi:uncharacterized protein [Coffea arabica]|uniref:Uncharacterized protein isoform X2 n=1 Tax=Coffea arabica TaxID=13443 RepID=A0ABM4VXV7_COFAR